MRRAKRHLYAQETCRTPFWVFCLNMSQVVSISSTSSHLFSCGGSNVWDNAIECADQAATTHLLLGTPSHVLAAASLLCAITEALPDRQQKASNLVRSMWHMTTYSRWVIRWLVLCDEWSVWMGVLLSIFHISAGIRAPVVGLWSRQTTGSYVHYTGVSGHSKDSQEGFDKMVKSSWQCYWCEDN